ncbi:hypothetical protein [Xanthocytophaga flava]|uniref:hypothetical protein n=1 Tax=Xanthocytophaga flava TaxID=3048013 RepID=UPI0028D68364|nr:hypothetical protein [Xanthocytophaga flavus]
MKCRGDWRSPTFPQTLSEFIRNGCLINRIIRVGNVGEHMGSPLQYRILANRVWDLSGMGIS